MNSKRERWSIAATYGALVLAVSFGFSGCAAKPRPDQRVGGAKDIFFFFDGTRNDAHTETNVRRTYQLVSDEGRPGTVTFYMEGVGDPRHPFSGAVFGKGKNDRLESMYAELIKIYRPGDRVYIYGFSRGALTARAFAGLVSYAGAPVLQPGPRTPKDYTLIAREINGKVRKVEDGAVMQVGNEKAEWATWQPGKPILASIKGFMPYEFSTERLETKVTEYKSVAIQFVGVWDTVPGSMTKEYPRDSCREEAMDDSVGTRYKTHSYPTIKRIAHAVALDEKRHRYELLHVCSPLTKETTVEERGFPGAHSDVGGGYKDKELANLSLNWMFQQLALTDYPIPETAKDLAAGNAEGLAHWSDSGLVMGSINRCEDRAWRTQSPDVPRVPPDASADVPYLEIDHSFYVRRDLKKACLLEAKYAKDKDAIEQAKDAPYPLTCDQFEKEFAQQDPCRNRVSN